MAQGVFAAGIPAELTTLTVAVGIVLLVIGILRIQARWLAAAAALLATATLLALFADDEPWQTFEVVSLRVRITDAATGRPIISARARIEDPSGKPTSVSSGGTDGGVLVSALVEAAGKGSLGASLPPKAPRVEVDGYHITVEAKGYRRWQMPLARLLPPDWPLNSSTGIIEVSLERATDAADFGF